MPRLPRKLVDAAENQMGIPLPRKMKSTGPAKASLEPQLVEPADQMPDEEKAKALAMNEEYVEIRIHDSTDQTANSIPDIYNNGVPQRFIRGQVQKVKWKFVEQLALCRTTAYKQEKDRHPDGTEYYRNIPHTALAYPFELVNAPQKFRDRLQVIMAVS